jgi:hypothetical protein
LLEGKNRHKVILNRKCHRRKQTKGELEEIKNGDNENNKQRKNKNKYLFYPQNWLILPKCHIISNKSMTSINTPALKPQFIFTVTRCIASVHSCSFEGSLHVVAQTFCFNLVLLFNILIQQPPVYIRKAPEKGLQDL